MTSTKAEARFWAGVSKPDEHDACWTWQRARNSSGYGQFRVNGHLAQVHRFAYEMLVGPIPEGLQLDHTCHDPRTCVSGPTCPHRACVNPAHLEPVTNRENCRRGKRGLRSAPSTHCKYGHELTPDNMRMSPKGFQQCITCIRGWQRNHWHRKHSSHEPVVFEFPQRRAGGGWVA